MNKSPLVSIVVAIYNVEKYLKECIDSLCEQTYENIEILLIDDGSTDTSGSICDEYLQRDSRVQVIHKQNEGPASARQCGIKSATGQFLMMIDGDDWIDKETISECMNSFIMYPDIELVLFSYVKEFPKKSIRMHVMDQDSYMDSKQTEEKIYRRLYGLSTNELNHPERMDNIVSCCMKLYKIELARKGRFFDVREISSSEDTLFNMYALHECGASRYIDRGFYHYRKIETSITNSHRENLEKKWARLFEIMNSIIEEKNLPHKYRDALDNRIALSIIGIGMNELGNDSKGILGHIRYIRGYLGKQYYRNAIKQMDIKRLPFVWKVFFVCCKLKFSVSVYFMLCAMAKLRSK